MVRRYMGAAGWLTVLVVGALALWTLEPGPSSAQNLTGGQVPADLVPGEILVQFRPGTSAQVIAETHRRNGGRVIEVISEIEVQVVRVPLGQEAASVAAYQRDPNVVFAELNGASQAAAERTR
jgi:thermitase